MGLPNKLNKSQIGMNMRRRKDRKPIRPERLTDYLLNEEGDAITIPNVLISVMGSDGKVNDQRLWGKEIGGVYVSPMGFVYESLKAYCDFCSD